MDNKEVVLLKKALERQKKARKQAERILEDKSKELYDVTHHLRESNQKLENLLSEKTSELDGIFINIIDPYVVMDLQFNVINMNRSAKDFLGFDHLEKVVNLSEFVHPDFLAYTQESMSSMMEVGSLKNYRAKIILQNGVEKWIQINASLVYDKNQRPIAAQGIIRDISIEEYIDKYLSKKKMMKDRATAMGGGMMRMGYAGGSEDIVEPSKSMQVDTTTYPLGQDPDNFPIKKEGSKIDLDIEMIKKLIEKRKKEKKKLAMGGIAGVL